MLLFQGTLNHSILERYVGVRESVGVLQTSDRDLEVISSARAISHSYLPKRADYKDRFFSIDGFHVASDSNARKVRTLWKIALGSASTDIARGLFSALRELDSRNVGVIFAEILSVEGGDAAAAVMNRLRKAAEGEIEC